MACLPQTASETSLKRIISLIQVLQLLHALPTLAGRACSVFHVLCMTLTINSSYFSSIIWLVWLLTTLYIAKLQLKKTVSDQISCHHQTKWFYRVKKNQLHAQLILSIFRQPLHVSGISRPIIRRYNHMYTQFQSNQDDSYLKRIVSNNCCIHTVVPPDDRPRNARNM
jgi:hypothetical protein